MRLTIALIAAGLAFASLPAAAQQYPSKPVRLIVPQTPGGATDVLARKFAQKFTERWGHPVVVENRPGAAGVVGSDLVAKAPPDGHTLLLTYAGSQAINPSLYAKMPFDSVNDFQPVATLAVVPFFMIVTANFPAQNLKEFIALARQKPDEITYASSGNGSVNHLLGEMLKTETGIKMIHIPYKGVAPAITDVISGQVNAAFSSVPSVIQHMQAGSVRALAVSSARRSSAAPDVPTIAEAGVPGFDVNPWWGILAPAHTPLSVVSKINADVAEIVKAADMREFYKSQGADELLTTPDQLLAMLKSDIATWAKVVKASGARID
jgi:tripartite-type tricarboxylate transporter receptor subunit TctC